MDVSPYDKTAEKFSTYVARRQSVNIHVSCNDDSCFSERLFSHSKMTTKLPRRVLLSRPLQMKAIIECLNIC